ncbi:F-box/kelch-repeat protein At3g23880-like [Rhododendron vialii]|uniref:F-box/kelch-repeat protein At3g23880-like n=1 Tax=Rhododendron vialii TaxID=182163 RepID=UPI00265E60E7|nr:F-box/kelch-repeat protein At3g23880-like [Rhododendron vialii]
MEKSSSTCLASLMEIHPCELFYRSIGRFLQHFIVLFDNLYSLLADSLILFVLPFHPPRDSVNPHCKNPLGGSRATFSKISQTLKTFDTITAPSIATNSNSTCREDSQPLPNLPPEIIVEILSRLPVNPLLRLRCVCKSWRSLISNPKFAKTHLCLASANTDYTNHRLLLNSLYPRAGVKSCSLYCILNEKSDSAVQLDCPLKVPNLRVTIWGCCDGLVCIGTNREVFIWNPPARKYKGLPNVEMLRDCFARFGFGYDDYKVVGFFFDKHASGSVPNVKVYTLRSDSWRRIGDCLHCVPPDAVGAFVNRALHWIHLSASSDSNDIIVSLDLVKEMYGEVSEPEYRDIYFYDISLGVLDGCLCILHNCSGACSDVWVMKEYGIRDSWTKLVVIPYLSHPSEPYLSHSSDCSFSAPLCILENGEVLLNTTTNFVRYNPNDGTFSYPKIYNWSYTYSPSCFSTCSPRSFSVYPYVESLVLPDSDADSGFQWQHQY